MSEWLVEGTKEIVDTEVKEYLERQNLKLPGKEDKPLTFIKITPMINTKKLWKCSSNSKNCTRCSHFFYCTIKDILYFSYVEHILEGKKLEEYNKLIAKKKVDK